MKKKVNRNKVPISASSFDVSQIKEQAGDEMVQQVLASLLATACNFHGTSQESLLKLWGEINCSHTIIRTHDDVVKELAAIEQIAGVKLPYQRIPDNPEIKTQGDLNRFKRRAVQNAFHAAIAIIFEPILRNGLFSEDDLQPMIHRLLSISEELSSNQISYADIQEMLLSEFNLILELDDGKTRLKANASTVKETNT